MSRNSTLLVTSILISCFCAVSASAQRRTRTRTPFTQQNSGQQNNARQEEASREAASEVPVESADIAITATVTAKELRFEAVPNPTVEFPGRPKRDTVWDAERDNLPRPVEPGVTYRNIGIRLKIVSRFADIDRIVAEALGEVPLTDEVKPEESTPSRQPSTPSPASTPRPDGESPK